MGAAMLFAAVLHRLIGLGIKLALVTKMPSQLAVRILLTPNIPFELFSCRITESDVTHPKPELEPFTLAINSLDALPHQCLMVGDRVKSDLLSTQKLRFDPWPLEMTFPIASFFSCPNSPTNSSLSPSGSFEPVEILTDGYKAICRNCHQSEWVGDSGRMYSLLGDKRLG